MPTAEEILGFSNRWYAEAIRQATTYHLPEGPSIRLVTAPYFVATKLEAFRGRGKNDYLGSRDLEDILAVVDGRPELADEVARASGALRTFIAQEIKALLDVRPFHDALPGHLPSDTASQQRVPLVLDRLHLLTRAGK